MDLQEIICALGSDGMLSQAATALQQGASLTDTLRADGLEEPQRKSDALGDILQRIEAEKAEYERQRAAYLAAAEQMKFDAAASRARFDEAEAMLRETHSMVSELYARLIPKEG